MSTSTPGPDGLLNMLDAALQTRRGAWADGAEGSDNYGREAGRSSEGMVCEIMGLSSRQGS
jgi:hypothetical protein